MGCGVAKDFEPIAGAWLSWLGDCDVPISDRARISIQADAAQWQLVYEPGPDLFSLFWKFQLQFLVITPTEQLKAVLLDAIGRISPGAPASPEEPLDLDNFFMKAWFWRCLLEPLLRGSQFQDGNFELGENALSDIIGRFAEAVDSSLLQYVTTVTPIANCDIQQETVAISPGIKLRRVPPDEIGLWVCSPAFAELHARPQFAGCAVQIDFVLSQDARDKLRRLQLPPLSWEKDQVGLSAANLRAQAKAEQERDRVVALLRLSTNRDISPLFTITEQNSFLCSFWSTTPAGSPEMGPITRLTDEDCERLKTLWKQLTTGPNGHRVELGLMRWAAARARRGVPYEARLKGMLIDYWIGLESLFCPDSTSELKYRASLRIAALLADNPKDRMTAYEDMRASYDWRSAIVHGNTSREANLEKALPLASVVSITGTKLREAILIPGMTLAWLPLGGAPDSYPLLRLQMSTRPRR